MDRLNQRFRRQPRMAVEDFDGPPGRLGRAGAVTQSVCYQDGHARLVRMRGPRIATDFLTRHRNRESAGVDRLRRVIPRAAKFGQRRGAAFRGAVDFHMRRKAGDSAEPATLAASGGVTILHALPDVGHPPALVECQDLEPVAAAVGRIQHQLAAPRMLYQVRGQFGRNNRHLADFGRAQADRRRHAGRHAPAFGHLARILHSDAPGHPHFHLVSTMRVPSPTRECIVNSFTRRRAPPRPKPRPVPVP